MMLCCWASCFLCFKGMYNLQFKWSRSPRSYSVTLQKTWIINYTAVEASYVTMFIYKNMYYTSSFNRKFKCQTVIKFWLEVNQMCWNIQYLEKRSLNVLKCTNCQYKQNLRSIALLLLHLFSEILGVNPTIMVNVNFLKQHIVQNETKTYHIILINSKTLTNTSNLIICRCMKYTAMLLRHYHLTEKLHWVL